VAAQNAARCSRCVPVATADSGTAASHAVTPSGGGNGAQPTAGTSRANEDGGLTATAREDTGSGALGLA
jgi:hypothetical protein